MSEENNTHQDEIAKKEEEEKRNGLDRLNANVDMELRDYLAASSRYEDDDWWVPNEVPQYSDTRKNLPAAPRQEDLFPQDDK